MDKWQGLNEREVEEARAISGWNVMAKVHKFSAARLLLSQFASPLMIVLLLAGAVSYFLHGPVDAVVVWVAVVINATLGFYQEYRAEKALEALEKQVELTAEVVRGSERRQVAVEELVPGDVVHVKAGDKVPADGEVLSAEALTVSEAMLTGESVPVEKRALGGEGGGRGKLYMGTVVLTGIGVMRVTKIGGETKMGVIAGKLVGAKRLETPLQTKMKQLARLLTVVIVVLSGLLLLAGIARGQELREMILVAVAVAVSAIPEGLVIALTVILVLGMQRLLKKRGLVRKLLAAETLGSVTVVCADKTGTLTLGEMRVVGSEGEEPRLAELAQLCNDLSDPLELAMKEWGEKLCQVSTVGCKIEEWERAATLPFSPELKYAATRHYYKQQERVAVRGAPEVVMELTKMSKKERQEWGKRCEALSSKGLRLVGLAERVGRRREQDLEWEELLRTSELKWAGLLVMEDPVREAVKEEIVKLTPAGVGFKVITGDFAGTARYVIAKLGIEVEGKVVTGREWRELSKSKKRQVAGEAVLFARFAPEDKLAVVELLQARGEVVAMMGDGVNDAPALKRADVGIVVAEATEVAKETADMVLLDSQFATVVEGIEEGRAIFVRIKRVVSYLLSDSFSEVVLVSVSLLLGLPLPVTAAQILWVNLANDTFPALALSTDPVEEGLLTKEPVRPSASIVNGQVKWLVGVVSLVSGLLVLGLFGWYLSRGYSLEYARTLAFFFLGINTLATVFVIRRMESWGRLRMLENKWLVLGVLAGVGMQMAAVYLPSLQAVFRTVALEARELFVVAAGSLVMMGMIEVLKVGMLKWAGVRRGQAQG